MNRRNFNTDIFFACLLVALTLSVFGTARISHAQSEVVITAEADQGMIDGGTIQQIEGFTFYEMESTGFIEWPFDIATGGTYDLVLSTRLPAGTQGQHISINGKRFKNQAFPGDEAFVFDANVLGMEWADYRISPDTILAASADTNFAGPEILTLEAGSHSLRIESSQGVQHFSGFSLIDAVSGDTAATVIAPDALAEEVIPMCDESEFCPTGFKSVALREGAFLTFNLLFPEDAMYQLRIFYNAPNGGFSNILLDWNEVVEDLNYSAEEGELLTHEFEGDAGNRSLTIDTERGGFNVDYVQLIKVNTATSTDSEYPGEGFSLSQNYPNPFNANTTISYTIGAPSEVTFTVFDVLGREVEKLVNSYHSAGTYEAMWDGRDADGKRVAGGIYFYQMETGAGIQTRRMIFMP